MVLALLPLQGGSLSARFLGPYEVLRQLSDTNYVVSTADWRRETRICHVNILKPHHSRDMGAEPPHAVASASQKSCDALTGMLGASGDHPTAHHGTRLFNSEMLTKLPEHVSHLEHSQCCDVLHLEQFSCLFSDVPTGTTVIEHDIDVGSAGPVKQHP